MTGRVQDQDTHYFQGVSLHFEFWIPVFTGMTVRGRDDGGGNAQGCYKQVLRMAPGNAQALSGMTAIEDKYIAQIQKALQRHHLTSAQTYLHRLKTLNEGHKEVAKLE